LVQVAIAMLTVVGIVSMESPAFADRILVRASTNSITWSFTPASIEQKTDATLAMCAHAVGAGSKYVIEEQEGTGNSWRPIALGPIEGHECTKRELYEGTHGRYDFRVQQRRDGTIRFQSPSQTLTVYGPVSLLILCDAVEPYPCSTKTQQIGGTVFTYVLSDTLQGGGEANYYTLLRFVPTSCRSISFQFGVNQNEATQAGPASLGIVQGRTAEQSASGAANAISSLKASLDGTAWYLDVWADYEGTGIWVNGSADCWTSNGIS
jgi:hypothetical protein